MTKSTITREQLIKKAQEQIEFCRHTKITGEGRAHVNQCAALFEIALAAMDSEPVGTLSVRHMSYSGKKIGNQFGFVHSDAAMTIAEGDYPLYRHAQTAQVVPDDVLKALQKVARIRLDMDGFDGDRRGIADCLCDAEEALIEVVNRRAAMLNHPEQHLDMVDHSGDVNEKGGDGSCLVIPDGWKMVPIDATRAMIDAARRVEEDGYDAMHKAMLAAAPQEVK
ncbi:hypothetical protein QCW82_004883 [Klebsiella michiganensis]|nr:hypothetical protein [Klebsiella michiganensis]